MKKRHNLIIIIAISCLICLFMGFFLGTLLNRSRLSNLNEATLNHEEKIIQLEQAYTFTNSSLVTKKTELNSCKNELTTTKVDLVSCADQTHELEKNYSETITQLEEEYKGEIESLESENLLLEDSLRTVEIRRNDLLTVVKSSARAVCCSFDDIEQSREVGWSIGGGQIICGANQESKVTC